jgi:hypothetical protein
MVKSSGADNEKHHVAWVPVTSLEHPQVVDGGDGLQVWIAAKILNKQ